jgi:hypothetical protein
MHELDPGSGRKLLTEKTGEAVPVLKTCDLQEIEREDDVLGGYVSLIWNKEAERAYIEVFDAITEAQFAIPVLPGQNARKIFETPFAYLDSAAQSANTKPLLATELGANRTMEELEADFRKHFEEFKLASTLTTEGREKKEVMLDNIDFVLAQAVSKGFVHRAARDE